jgi:Prenyltransferase and squalene oxidase repeat
VNLNQRLWSGYKFLATILNDDGGIPAISESDVSGIWTTAEGLEAVLSVPAIPQERFTLASRMWALLIETQLAESDHAGAWPLVKLGTRGSAMATGNAITAISRCQAYFGARCPDELTAASDRAIAWLTQYQSEDGGWGVEPSTRPTGAQPRMISTTYAVAGFTAVGYTVETSQVLRKAKHWLLSMRGDNGGFRGGQGHPTDPCNTSRAVRALIEMRALTPDDKTVHTALRYLISQKPKGRLWTPTTESFVIEGSSGEVIFNSNTPFDALMALLQADPTNPAVIEIVRWYESNQQMNGSWALTPDDPSRSHICTWSTNEALIGLSAYSRDTPDVSAVISRRERWSKRIIVAVALALLLETLLLLRVNNALVRAWNAIPKAVQTIILLSVILATVVNLFSNTIYDFISRRRRKR